MPSIPRFAIGSTLGACFHALREISPPEALISVTMSALAGRQDGPVNNNVFAGIEIIFHKVDGNLKIRDIDLVRPFQ